MSLKKPAEARADITDCPGVYDGMTPRLPKHSGSSRLSFLRGCRLYAACGRPR